MSSAAYHVLGFPPCQCDVGGGDVYRDTYRRHHRPVEPSVLSAPRRVRTAAGSQRLGGAAEPFGPARPRASRASLWASQAGLAAPAGLPGRPAGAGRAAERGVYPVCNPGSLALTAYAPQHNTTQHTRHVHCHIVASRHATHASRLVTARHGGRLAARLGAVHGRCATEPSAAQQWTYGKPRAPVGKAQVRPPPSRLWPAARLPVRALHLPPARSPHPLPLPRRAPRRQTVVLCSVGRTHTIKTNTDMINGTIYF